MNVYFAAPIAQTAFWVLLVCGWYLDELGWKSTSIFLTLWMAGYVVRMFVPNGVGLFWPYVAALDIALVFAIFKGDVGLK